MMWQIEQSHSVTELWCCSPGKKNPFWEIITVPVLPEKLYSITKAEFHGYVAVTPYVPGVEGPWFQLTDVLQYFELL